MFFHNFEGRSLEESYGNPHEAKHKHKHAQLRQMDENQVIRQWIQHVKKTTKTICTKHESLNDFIRKYQHWTWSHKSHK